jgi:tetratricopeptide (TPR) repeat protein
MPELSWEELVTEIEGAIESGRFADAQRFLHMGETRYGASPEAAELRRRLLEIERLARPPAAELLVQQAETLIRNAAYGAAMTSLRQAAELAPSDEQIRRLLAQTKNAEARQRAAIEQNQAVVAAASEIETLLGTGDLAAARRRLQAIGVEHRGHSALSKIRERLRELEKKDQGRRSQEHLAQAQTLLEKANWYGAQQEAERILRRDPENQAAQEIYFQARDQLDEEQKHRHLREAAAEAQHDVERLIGARELAQAARRLKQAVDTIGDNEDFANLAQSIDKARSDIQFRQRVEWAERRSNEASRLMQEAASLSLRGDYGTAIERLKAAHELDPTHPEIEDKLNVATIAFDRQLVDRKRNEAMAARSLHIRSQLEVLQLDQAADSLELARREFGEEERFRPLERQLEQLREAEHVSSELARLTPADLDAGTSSKILAKQRLLRSAYPWQMALLYPFRGSGRLTVFWLAALLATALEFLASGPHGSIIFAIPRVLLGAILLGVFPTIVRLTVAGKNRLPTLKELAEPTLLGRDMARIGSLFFLCFLPLGLWLFSRGLHGLLGAHSSPWGWLVGAALAWLGCALMVLLSGAVEVFGKAWPQKPQRHLEAFRAAPSDTLVVVDATFLLLIAVVLLRAAFVPMVSWLGAPLASFIEIYALFAVPHLVGVLVRHRRLELARVYGGTLAG